MKMYSKELIEKANNSTIDTFVKGYEIQDEYIDESVHTTMLYDGISILSNHDNFKIIQKSISSNICAQEEFIASCYKIYNDVDEIHHFLINNKDKIKECVLNERIASFTRPRGKARLFNSREGSEHLFYLLNFMNNYCYFK